MPKAQVLLDVWDSLWEKSINLVNTNTFSIVVVHLSGILVVLCFMYQALSLVAHSTSQHLPPKQQPVAVSEIIPIISRPSHSTDRRYHRVDSRWKAPVDEAGKAMRV